MAALRNLETVEICSDIVIYVFAKLLYGLLLFFVPGVTQALEEEEGETKSRRFAGSIGPRRILADSQSQDSMSCCVGAVMQAPYF